MENRQEDAADWRARMHRSLDHVMDCMAPATRAEDIEGFEAGGVFHPIRGGEGYKPGKVGERRRWKKKR
jgi:hypothetical protein